MTTDMPIQSAAMCQVFQVRWAGVVGARSLFHSGEPERSTFIGSDGGTCAPLEELPVLRAADVLAVLDDRLAPAEDRLNDALDAHALVQVVVAVLRVGLGAADLFLVRVEDHDVGVAADGDCALLREHAEHLGAGSRGDVDPLVQAEPALDDGAVVDHGKTVLNTRPPIWN